MMEYSSIINIIIGFKKIKKKLSSIFLYICPYGCMIRRKKNKENEILKRREKAIKLLDNSILNTPHGEKILVSTTFLDNLDSKIYNNGIIEVKIKTILRYYNDGYEEDIIKQKIKIGDYDKTLEKLDKEGKLII